MSNPAIEVEIVVRTNGTADLFVDGKEFPWNVLWEGIEVEADSSSGHVPVKLTLLAERVITRLEEAPAPPPEPEPWSVGWEFKPGEAGTPPEHVQSIRCVDDDSHHPVLARYPEGWTWTTEDERYRLFPKDLGQPWDTWVGSAGSWNDRVFRVVRVSD